MRRIARWFGASFIDLVLIGLVVVLAGALAPAPARASSPRDVAGADYSWYRPSERELAASGVGWVARYLVPRSWRSGKALSAGEAASLRRRGTTIVLNFEWRADSARGGYAAGVADARAAELARVEVGAPADSVIYFSVDYDERRPAVVLDYLMGATAVLGAGRVGVYGGYYPIKAAGDAGYVYLWQTYAWSFGQWDRRAPLRQIANGALWRGQGDRNVAISDRFGGWGGLPKLDPTPDVPRRPLAPNPPGAGVYVVQPGDTLTAIARRYGTTVGQLAARNGIRNPNLIRIGQRLQLAGGQVRPDPQPPNGGRGVPRARVYVVRPGDTLSALGRRFGTTVGQLAARNRIRDVNRIYVGQRLSV